MRQTVSIRPVACNVSQTGAWLQLSAAEGSQLDIDTPPRLELPAKATTTPKDCAVSRKCNGSVIIADSCAGEHSCTPSMCEEPRPCVNFLTEVVQWRTELDKQPENPLHVWLLQGGASSVAAYLETANPLSYLIYMLGAGVGLPVSVRLSDRTRSCSSPSSAM